MNKHLYLLAMLLFPLLSFGQNEKSAYDAALAKKLGADDYGMKRYVLVLLKTGTANTFSKPQTDSLFAGHMNNINRLVTEGKLVVAGPFAKNDQYRGLFILNAATLEEGKALVATDPAVQAKLLDADYLVWYGSAALAETLEIHRKIELKSH